MLAQPQVVLPLLARRYVAWRERNVVQECLELRITELAAWSEPVAEVPGVEFVTLPACGPEWLLCRLHRECFADSPGYRPAGPLHILALRAAPYHDPHGIFVARLEGRCVGFCIGRPRPAGKGLINGLGVHPDFRGRGIGRALLCRGLGYLQQKGATEALIRVHPENRSALNLYRSEGFE